ncbi:hypothetical protein AWC38_SpisGene820 [Stylophora pistillata]|uniref:Peptidase S72 domain-containing protein n=1 Tax=Stylophora pistillata TaxID=50429 RepID=A0A2B4T0E0_STYPI|nr:hypothetical protein AWC38_SpisGene820 [Stylophora pistillata]
MSKALAVLKLFFSLVSINSTEHPLLANSSSTGAGKSPPTSTTTRITPKPIIAYVGQTFRKPIPQEIVDALKKRDITNVRFIMKTFHYGDILPSSWVQFNPRKREVYGFPLPGNAGRFFYKMIANYKTGASVFNVTFELRVKAKKVEHSHELILSTGINFQQFMTKVALRISFAEKLARYCFNEKPEIIYVKSFDKASRNLTIVFSNIPYSPCDENTYKKLKSSVIDEDTKKLKKEFQKALTNSFPVKSAQFRFFGACDPNLLGPEPPFEWGWLTIFMPIAILVSVIGIPVGISCFVNRYMRTKRPVVKERRTLRTLRPRNEDGMTDLTSHTVHFNNRYPSMLSVSNNSKEDGVGEDERGVGAKANVPNGSPSSRHLTVPNSTANRPRQGAVAANDNSKNSPNHKNPFKFPYNRDKGSFNVREMWDDDDDSERPPLNIPTYYTYRNTEEAEPSMLDAVLDMNFSDIAENISTKIKGVKSMLNIPQAETGQQDEAKPTRESSDPEPSLSSKLKGIGKSMLNLSAAPNDTTGAAYSTFSAAPSLSTKLMDFGKSMLNLSTVAQNEDRKETQDLQYDVTHEATYDDSDYDDESYVYKTREYEDTRCIRGHYDDARQRHDLVRSENSEFRYSLGRENNTSEYKLSQHNTPTRRQSVCSGYQQKAVADHYDGFNFFHNEKQGNRKYSIGSDFDEYPDSLFDAPSEFSQEEKTEHEKSIFDADFDEETPCLAKPTTLWDHVPASKERNDPRIESYTLNEVRYQEYVNPCAHQYSKGPTRAQHRRSSLGGLGTNSYSSQSTLDFWDDDEYNAKTNWNHQRAKSKDDFFTSFGKSKGGIPNGTMPKSKAKQGNSLLSDVGSLFSRNTRDTREKPPVVFTLGDEDEEQEEYIETDNSMRDVLCDVMLANKA